jgi:SAM-dependent methyltransferase
MTDGALPIGAAEQLYVFRKSLPLRVKLKEIVRALGDADGLVCLDIGADSGVFSCHLRRNGGKWDTAVRDEATAALVRALVTDSVYVLDGQSLPFKKKSYDAVALVDALERMPGDIQFIEECHKILKPDGRLIVTVQRVRKWTPIRLLRRMLGLTYDKKGMVREGYTETELFNVLKDGFDVVSTRPFSRFFMELTDTVVEALLRRTAAAGGGRATRRPMFYSVANAFYWLADQLDMLLFLSRGYRLIAVAKRRAWRPRKAPVLVDGRSITEAVLSRAAN